jgi:nitrogen regulatory protein PII
VVRDDVVARVIATLCRTRDAALAGCGEISVLQVQGAVRISTREIAEAAIA